MPTATEKFVNWITGMPIALFDAVGSIFNASGTNHTIGLVPDPGATPGTTKFLREDATWVAPVGAGSITNAQLASVPTNTFKARNDPGDGPPEDLTVTEATALLNIYVGDSGSGGTKGLVLAPASADKSTKSLNSDGTWHGGFIELASGSGGAVATLDIVFSNFTTGFTRLELELTTIPVTDGVDLWMRTSSDGGLNYDTTLFSYAYIAGADDGSLTAGIVAQTTAQVLLDPGLVSRQIGNGSNEGINAIIEIYNANSAAFWPRGFVRTAQITNSATPGGVYMSGMWNRRATQQINAVRFLFSSGNLASYSYILRGVT